MDYGKNRVFSRKFRKRYRKSSARIPIGAFAVNANPAADLTKKNIRILANNEKFAFLLHWHKPLNLKELRPKMARSANLI